jgi:predicted Zn finger-like uncharacterized protein
MKAPVACPNCESSFNVSRENEGKRAKCPKCEQSFVISFAIPESPPDDFAPRVSASPPPVPASNAPNPSQPAFTATPKPNTKRSTRKRVTLPQWAVIAIPAIVTLILGYFIGREHLKYQMRSAIADVATAFSEGLKGNSTSKSSSSPLGSINTPAEPTPEPLPQLMLGQTHTTKQFAITLNSAKIETAKVKDMMGDIGTGKNPDLILSFTFANTDDRRILRFRKGNQFMAGHFRLRDDVDNVIRGINYGIASKPVGALTGSEDIAPGSSATHVELFSIPPPKTEFLVLTVDLACLGGDGEIEFKIPASSIAK